MTMRTLTTLGLLLLCALSVVAGARPAVARGSVHVPAHAEVRASVVRLGEVARIAGFDRETAGRLAAIDLGPSPLVGTGRLLPRAYLTTALREGGLPGGASLKLPERLEVTRRAEVLSGKALTETIERKLRMALGDTVEIATLRVPAVPDIKVPAGSEVDVTVNVGDAADGAATAEILIRDGGALVRSQKLAVKVDAVVEVWTMVEERPRGHVVTAEDLQRVRVPRSRMAVDAIRSPAEVDGGTLKRAVGPGEQLTRRYVEMPPIVSRGDRVTMVARSGGIRITAVGEALGSARQGEPVRVRNIDSLKIISGRAVAAQTVEMEL
jgi:flagella basal body P-ring formation protein FlgA